MSIQLEQGGAQLGGERGARRHLERPKTAGESGSWRGVGPAGGAPAVETLA